VPHEDDQITLKNLVNIIDKETGEAMDVRSVLGLNEEDLANDPELLAMLKEMNMEMPQAEEKKSSNNGPKKLRGFDFFDTIPAENIQLENEYKDKVELTDSII